ncbi:helix-turn-helix transcriptional regulator [Alicyclobacillus fructus]|uniref:helix-turn-helix transcriptional regulator n=1 Tax=Alicyclobacillus fructus TaxID=2816082 RepID=UPI001A8EA2D1|nr:helix-turn-helix transcriptional regulator [Alicyclobacillus fructus]
MRHLLRQARLERGWTQAEAARRLNMSEREYRHLELGTRKPSLDNLRSIHRVFGIPYEQLVEGVFGDNTRCAP